MFSFADKEEKRKANHQACATPGTSKRGRPSVQQLFPGIVETANKLIESNGFEAHRRQQETTVCIYDFTCKEPLTSSGSWSEGTSKKYM